VLTARNMTISYLHDGGRGAIVRRHRRCGRSWCCCCYGSVHRRSAIDAALVDDNDIVFLFSASRKR